MRYWEERTRNRGLLLSFLLATSSPLASLLYLGDCSRFALIHLYSFAKLHDVIPEDHNLNKNAVTSSYCECKESCVCMQDSCKVDVRIRSPEVALEEYCHDQFQVVVTCHVTSLVPNKTRHQTGLSSRIPCICIQEVLGWNLSQGIGCPG
jgi:hypothetical protein